MGFHWELGTELQPNENLVRWELGMELRTHAHIFPLETELGVGAWLFQVCRELGKELGMLGRFSVLVLHTRWQDSGNMVQWMELCTI